MTYHGLRYLLLPVLAVVLIAAFVQMHTANATSDSTVLITGHGWQSFVAPATGTTNVPVYLTKNGTQTSQVTQGATYWAKGPLTLTITSSTSTTPTPTPTSTSTPTPAPTSTSTPTPTPTPTSTPTPTPTKTPTPTPTPASTPTPTPTPSPTTVSSSDSPQTNIVQHGGQPALLARTDVGTSQILVGSSAIPTNADFGNGVVFGSDSTSFWMLQGATPTYASPSVWHIGGDGTVLNSWPIGVAGDRPAALVVLADGRVMAWTRDAQLPSTVIKCFWYDGSWHQLSDISFVENGLHAVAAQHPFDGSAWLFALADGGGPIHAFRYSTAGPITLSWANTDWLDNNLSSPPVNLNGPDNENAFLAITATSDHLLLMYESADRFFASLSPLITVSRPKIVFVGVTGSQDQFLALPEYVERTEPLGLYPDSTGIWTVTRPVNTTTFAYQTIVAMHWDGTQWGSPLAVGQTPPGLDPNEPAVIGLPNDWRGGVPGYVGWSGDGTTHLAP